MTKPPPEVVLTGRINGRRVEKPDAWIRFEDADVSDCDFSSAFFDHFSTRGSVFERCDFTKTRFGNARFSVEVQSAFRSCRFDGADLWSRNLATLWLGQARFERCSFRRAKVRGWLSHDAEFVDCSFEGKVESCRFFGRPVHPETLDPPRARNEFTGNDFSRADLISTTFELGIDLNRQLLPDDAKYLRLSAVPQRVAAARSRILGWEEGERRDYALRVLTGILEQEQDEVFVGPEAIGYSDVTRTVWQLLTEV